MLPAEAHERVTWCGGVKVIGNRLPGADDRARAAAMARSCRRFGVISVVSIPIAIVVAIALVILSESLMEHYGERSVQSAAIGWSCFAIVIIGAIAAIVLTVFSMGYFRRAATIEAD